MGVLVVAFQTARDGSLMRCCREVQQINQRCIDKVDAFGEQAKKASSSCLKRFEIFKVWFLKQIKCFQYNGTVIF